MVQPVIVRIVLTLALSREWQITQLDVNNSFLNDILTEEVYMQQPPRFVQPGSTLVCKLNKAIYGLK